MKIIITALFSTLLLLSSCNSDLKTSYSCKCEDLWSKIKGHEYEEFEKAWGQPMDTDSQWEEKKIGYKWKIDGLYDCPSSSACGEIWVWFEGAQSENGEILPMGNCKYANCYNGGNEQFRELIGNE
jgi:hypothetical protein